VRAHLLNTFQGVAYQPSKENVFEGLLTVAYGAKFNPVLDYLDALKWDGVPRVAKLFGSYFRCCGDDYTRAVSACFMVGAVRRMRRPGCKFDTMPILRGKQGWNKSTGVRALFGADWFSDADLGSLRDKDAAMKLRGIWVQEFAELESLTRAETGALKAFCSRATDRQRDPYGRITEDTPRRCVFLGTTNEGGFLKDSTGARRFWPLEVRKPIDTSLIAADRDQLWAEAAHMEAQGASDILPRELWGVAADRQAEQTSGDPWADTLTDFLAVRAHDAEKGPDPDTGLLPPPADRVLTVELFDALDIAIRERTKDKAQRLRTVMESTLGWHHNRNVRMSKTVRAGYTRERM
jgi:predicted P-loop ATPase